MRVCGIVSEYNPFHNGHLYHLMQAKKQTGCDYILCIMSGNFTQRGEAAIFDKWVRTHMALSAGADAVIELPILYVLQPAEWFAYGAVKILHELGVVTHLSFGSEIADFSLLNHLAEFLLNEPEEYQDILRDHLKIGMSFPKAQAEALISYFTRFSFCHQSPKADIIKAISSPNSILGIEYLKALRRLESSIIPVPIPRIHASYHSTDLKEGISSATAIRKAIQAKGFCQQVKDTVPSYVYEICNEEASHGNGPVFTKDFENIILSAFRKLDLQEIASLPDISEGLENRIKKMSNEKTDLEDFLMAIKSKRYVFTRLQRISLYALLGIQRKLIKQYTRLEAHTYARLLGFRKNSVPLLTEIKRKSSIPLISKAADFFRDADGDMKKLLSYDVLATDIYSLAVKNPLKRMGGRDFSEEIVIMP
ncbi:MAG: nucleotidyltransferase [Clostridia bacterium]